MRKWYPAFLVALSVAVSVYAYPRLPARVTTHWDIHGQPNGYSSRLFAAVFFPLLLLALWGFLRGLPRIDPRRANYAKMQGSYDLVVNAALTIVVIAHVGAMSAALGAHVNIVRVVTAAVGAMIALIGNVLPRARPNWWFGIRTPWTLSNDRVWERTHRVGGYVMTAIGALAILASILGVTVASAAVGIAAAALGLGLIAYSYFAWKQETSR